MRDIGLKIYKFEAYGNLTFVILALSIIPFF